MSGKSRRDDPDNSEQAAREVDNATCHGKIFKVLSDAAPAGMIIDELADATGIDRQTLSTRMTECEERNMVYRVIVGLGPTGKIQYQSRMGKRGRKQQEWFILHSARQALAARQLPLDL
jgi:hypothetical protein